MLYFFRGLLLGIISSFSFQVAPLYRYPYYQSGEALRGDWMKIGKDVEASLTHGEGYDNE